MDEMKQHLIRQEKLLNHLTTLSGLVTVLSNSLSAIEMDEKTEYMNAAWFISESLSETQLELQCLSDDMFKAFRKWKSQTYALLQEYPV
ncbi:hypothetical protein [Anaerotignum sp.]